jgi:hypothetical protein
MERLITLHDGDGSFDQPPSKMASKLGWTSSEDLASISQFEIRNCSLR